MEAMQIIFLFFALVLCAFLIYDAFGFVDESASNTLGSGEFYGGNEDGDEDFEGGLGGNYKKRRGRKKSSGKSGSHASYSKGKGGHYSGSKTRRGCGEADSDAFEEEF